MDRRIKNKIMKMAGKIFLGEKVERLAFEYIIKNPKVTAEELSNVILAGYHHLNAIKIKIRSPTVAQYYIDWVNQCVEN